MAQEGKKKNADDLMSDFSEDGGGSKVKTLAIAAIVGLMLLGGAGGAFFYFKNSASKATEETTEESADASHDSKKGEKESAEGGHEKPKEEKKEEKSEGGEHKASAKEDKESGKESSSEHGGGGGGDKDVLGYIHRLEPFIVNLNEVDSTRYLKLSMELEVTGEGVSIELDKRAPQVRDTCVNILSSKGFGDIQTGDGKYRLKEELMFALNKILTSGSIKSIYFTQFVVQ